MRRFLSVFVVFASCFVATPVLRAATSPEDCGNGTSFGVCKMPMTPGGAGGLLGKLIDPRDGRGSLRIRAELADDPIACINCIRGTIRGYLDDGSGGAPRYAVEGTYEGTTVDGTGRFDLRVIALDGSTTVGEIHGQFESPRALGFRGRFRGDWRIC